MLRVTNPIKNVLRRVSIDMRSTKEARPIMKVLKNLPDTQVTTLPNGMRIATENSGAPTATVGLWIDAGSRYENPTNNGVAHFLEHMAFKGTENRSQTQLEMEIENMGAHLNAYTSREQTVFYAKCLKEDVDKSMDILADIVLNSKLGENEIERERSVILREMEEIEGNLQEVVFDHLHANAFQGTSLAQTILGPTENIKSIQRKHLLEFIKIHYTTGNMVLAASGGVDHDALVKSAEKLFGGLTDGFDSAYQPDPGLKRYTGSEMQVWNELMPMTHIGIAVESVGWTHPDNLALMVASTLVGSWDRTHPNSAFHASTLARHFYNLKAHSFQSFNTCYRDTGLWGIYYTVEKEDIQDSIINVTEEWMRICERVSDFEVERAKNMLRTNLLLMLDGTTANCEDIGRQMLVYGRRIPLLELDERIKAINAEIVRDACFRHIYDANPTLVGIGHCEEIIDFAHLQARLAWYRS